MSKVSQVEAAKRLLTLKKASQTFKGFVKAMTPQFELADFQLELIQALEDLEQGIGPRKLLITMPPRHGKSWLASTLFPIYYLAKKPNRNILATSYNQDLAKTFGRQTRDNAREPLVAQAFPDFVLSEESRAVDDWRTTYGGTYYATGMGGSTTGRAATLLLIDDPIKAREEADSPTQRNKTWSYYVSALTTRKQPEPDGTKPIEIVILTRWHPDDLAGRIMETEDWKNGEWKHINFPAIREVNANIKKSVAGLPESDPRYIPQGELSSVAPSKRYYYEKEMRALWEVRFPIEELEKRRKLDPREFESLYQQNPYIQGGNLIKSSWWQTYDPEDVEPPQMLLVAADTAFKKTETADYSVLMTLGMTRSGDIYIMDVVRDRYDFPELKRACIMINNVNRGRGLRGFYIEDKASGQSLIQELKSQSGMSVIPYKVNTDKVARLNSVTPLIEGGRVFLPKSAPWLDIFMAEAETFPNGKHDDQMDALSIGLDAMSRMSVSTGDVFTAPIDPRTSLNNSLNGQVQKNQGWTRDHNGNWVDDIGKEKTYTVWGEL